MIKRAVFFQINLAEEKSADGDKEKDKDKEKEKEKKKLPHKANSKNIIGRVTYLLKVIVSI